MAEREKPPRVVTAVVHADGLQPLPLAGRRPALCRLSRRGMGRARIRRPRPVREARARRLPGRAVVDHHPAQARRRSAPPSTASSRKRSCAGTAPRRGADGRPRHRAQPRQDRGDSALARIDLDLMAQGRLRPPSLGLRRRPADPAGAREPRRHPGGEREVARDGQGPARAGRQFRRPDDRLRLHAGDRHGQRPPRRLLPARGLPRARPRFSAHERARPPSRLAAHAVGAAARHHRPVAARRRDRRHRARTGARGALERPDARAGDLLRRPARAAGRGPVRGGRRPRRRRASGSPRCCTTDRNM